MSQHIKNPSELPSTPEEALSFGFKFYFTGEPCTKGHIAIRDTSHNNKCYECLRISNRKAQKKYATKPEVIASNSEHSRKYSKRKYHEDIVASRLKCRIKYYQKRLDKLIDELSDHEFSRKSM